MIKTTLIILAIILVLAMFSPWLALFVVAVLLINLFTFWSAIGIFLISFWIIYKINKNKPEKNQLGESISKESIMQIAVQALILTILAIIIALATAKLVMVSEDSSEGSTACTRATPEGC